MIKIVIFCIKRISLRPLNLLAGILYLFILIIWLIDSPKEIRELKLEYTVFARLVLFFIELIVDFSGFYVSYKNDSNTNNQLTEVISLLIFIDL